VQLYLAYLWGTVGTSVGLVIGTLCVVSWNFSLAGEFEDFAGACPLARRGWRERRLF
jgi:hypothetical protein